MFRAALVVLAAASPARAEILPSFGTGQCESNATHVVVVDDTGKVLESWRGDLAPGDVLPIAEFRLPKEAGHRPGFGIGPKTVSGKRVVLFLVKDGP